MSPRDWIVVFALVFIPIVGLLALVEWQRLRVLRRDAKLRRLYTDASREAHWSEWE